MKRRRVWFVVFLMGCAPAGATPVVVCGSDAECQGSRASLYDVEPLTDAQMDSLLAERER